MDHATKAKFVLALHKHSLRALDSGGDLTVGGTKPDNANPFNFSGGASSGAAQYGVNPVANMGQTIGMAGDVTRGLASDFTTQNQYEANAPTSLGVVGGQQNELASQLEGEIAGGGPQPAQRQLLKNTQNIAQNQATNYANNRALNPGLAARMAGQNAAAANAGAVNDAAIQQANQQIKAQELMGNLTGQEQAGALTAQGINAQIAQNNVNSVNKAEAGLLGGLSGSSLLGKLLATGGDVKKYDFGGEVSTPGVPNLSNAAAVAGTSYGSDGSGSKKQTPQKQPSGGGGGSSNQNPPGGTMSQGGGKASLGGNAVMEARGGRIKKPVRLSDGGDPNISNDSAVSSTDYGLDGGGGGGGGGLGMLAMLLNKGGKATNKNLMKSGGKVNVESTSQRAVKKDDSLKNDKVPALLSEGEIVIPRHITMHPDAPNKAAAFVQAVINKRKLHSAKAS